MDFKKPLNNLLQKEVDRKEFLTHVGAGALAVIGVTSLLKALGEDNKTSSAGYGGSSYGGGNKLGKPSQKLR